MNRRHLTPAVLTLTAAVALFAATGCGGNNNSTNSSTGGTPQLITVYPPDGATNVPIGSGVSLVFDRPMDTTSVHAAFHFCGGATMQQWMDSLDHHIGTGSMMDGHYEDMDHMMAWMDSIELPGTFEWNAALDSCRFFPDSALRSGTRYMTFMYGGIQSMSGGMHMMQDEAADSTTFSFTTAP